MLRGHNNKISFHAAYIANRGSEKQLFTGQHAASLGGTLP